jgi:hypothetical protein
MTDNPVRHAVDNAERWMTFRAALAVVICTGCSGTSPSPTTGLTGVVFRGPTAPVCEINEPCDAPLSAGFTVDQGSHVVSHFQSDAAGRFTVMLQPATYLIVPDANTPIIAPTSQAKTVVVGQVGLTNIQLMFDTGIR